MAWLSIPGYAPRYGGSSGGDEILSNWVRILLPNELCWDDISPEYLHYYEIRWLRKTAFSTISASLGGQFH
jgi:hypothetical protein